jgi:heat shock protein HtpX
MPRVAVLDDPALNAFATGRDPEHAVVVATAGLLESLDRDELEAVMAHELGHVYNRDTLVSSVCAVCVGIVTLVVNGLLNAGTRSSSRNRSNIGAFLLGALLAITLLPAVQLVMLAVSRRREALADLTGVQFCRNPEALHSALQKVTRSGTVPMRVKPSTAHLYFYMPKLRGRDGGPLDWMSDLTSSHPSPKERLDTLTRVQHGQSIDYLFQSRASFGLSCFVIGLITLALVAVPAWLLGGRNTIDVGSLHTPAISITAVR